MNKISWAGALFAACLVQTAPAQAASYLDLPAVKPVMTCEQLAKADIARATSTPAAITSTTVFDTPKGPYCRVLGTVAPQTSFEVDLPIERWTQRFVQNALNRIPIGNAGGCAPALNGEMVVATSNGGHSGRGQTDSAWTSDLQLRIDFAYRANHETALAAKALIRAFYGQPQRFAYFVGCSEGGRQALQEAQRYPDDFDGVAAGAPVGIDSVHNAFFHPWEAHANTQRADGSRTLTIAKLDVLHKAVVAHCAKASGLIDGMLQVPSACKFDPAWVRCAAGADAATCLTSDEAAVAARLYEGPSDGKGNRFHLTGFPLGSENFWRLSTATEYGDRETKEGFALRRLIPPPEGEQSAESLEDAFTFSQAWYQKVNVLAPLYNAVNTNLRPFQQHGSKLILWHGAADLTTQHAISLAYFQGVQKQLGAAATDSFMRYFLLPGVGHCAGGEGPAQIDVLTPLMAWVELKEAPDHIVTGKTPPQPQGQGGPGGGGPNYPLATANRETLYTRPIYPFPSVARYSGKGDPNDAANYVRAKAPVTLPQRFNSQAEALIGPNNQAFYGVSNGQLVKLK
jgi:feruloyl esterase